MQIHNCHAHVFTSRAVAGNALSLHVVSLTRSRTMSAMLNGIMRWLPLRRVNRMAALVGIGREPNAQAILDTMKSFYPENSCFVLLPMDFEFAGVGSSPQTYLEQLEELAALVGNPDNRVKPFVAADPRRPNLLGLIREYIEERGFAGIKVYPPLGYFPFDPALNSIYGYAEANEIPVLTHCSRGGVYYKGKITKAMKTHPLTNERLGGWPRSKFSDNWTDPRNWSEVLKRHPMLKLCLAHFGGVGEWKKYWKNPARSSTREETWFSTIADLIEQYEHVYADVSFTAHYRKYWPLLKVLLNTDKIKDRILFGSDFYMVRIKGKEKVASIALRAAVGEQEYRRMAETNPKRFLP